MTEIAITIVGITLGIALGTALSHAINAVWVGHDPKDIVIKVLSGQVSDLRASASAWEKTARSAIEELKLAEICHAKKDSSTLERVMSRRTVEDENVQLTQLPSFTPPADDEAMFVGLPI